MVKLRFLDKVRRLSSAERKLLLEASVMLACASLGLLVLSVPRVQRLLNNKHERIADCCFSAKTVAWAVQVASHYLGQNCLPRSLVLQAMLNRYGFPAELKLGVQKSGVQAIDAHAWVESEGEAVIREQHTEDYHCIGSLESR